MTRDPDGTVDHEKRIGRLRRVLDRAPRDRQGDTIVADISEGAHHVAVGKNIIQIGTLRLPIWFVVVVAASMVIGAVTVVLYAILTGGWVQTIQEAVLAGPTTAPTATPTPTPTPEPMKGDFNIAIAKPIALDAANDPRIAEFRDWYAEELRSEVESGFGNKYQLKALELNPEVRVVPITVADPNKRQQAVADYARKIRAHVLLYGVLDTSTDPARYLPEFYIHPDLLVGAEEITGSDAFGDPIDVRFAEGGVDSLTWKVDLAAPVDDLSAFVIGVSLFEAGEYDRVLELFRVLKESDQWASGAGKAILYLWLGTTHHVRALEQAGRGMDPQRVRCLATGQEELERECAKLSYELAIMLKEDYPRAYLGLGNYWLDAEDLFGCERFDPALEQYLAAKEKAEMATGQEAQFVQTSLVPMKALYQLGLAHAKALLEGCPELQAHDQAADAYLSDALALYDQAESAQGGANSSYRDLASRSSYMLGQVHQAIGRDAQALAAYDRTIEIAELPGVEVDPWPSIRWVAGNQIGAIYLAQVEAGNYDVFEHGRAALQTVIRAYDDRQFGSTYTDLPVVASAALYHLGRLYSAMAQRDSNAIDTSSLVEAVTYLERSRDVLKTLDLQASAQQSDELHWRATVQLGHVYRLWGESGDIFMYGDALNTYQEVLDAIDNGAIADGEVAADLLSEAAYGLGAVHHAQGDDEQAVEYLNLAIDARNSRPVFVESAQRLLQDIAGPDASGD